MTPTLLAETANDLPHWLMRDICAPTPRRPNRAAFVVQEVKNMTTTASLPERITAASRELKLARRDGSAEWITKAAKELDELLDKIPRAAQRQESAHRVDVLSADG